MGHNIYIYIAVMAVTTYLIRVLPITLVRKDITNRFVKSFLYYVPYVCLAVMTFPAVLYSGASMFSASIGFFVVLVFAYCGKNMFLVALYSSLSVFLTERALEFFNLI